MEMPGAFAPQTRNRLLGILLLLSFLLDANCIFNGFVYDDHSQIERNPYVHSFRYLGKLFGSSLLSQQGKQAVPNFYRPLTNFTFLIGYKLFGDSPMGYHLFSVLLNCIAIWLVYLVGNELFRSDSLALLAAFLFALHPAHVEPVAWIDGIGDPLATVFVLMGFWFFLRLGQSNSVSRTLLYTGMIICFVAGIFTKETAVIFPVLATFFEHFYRADRLETTWTQKLSRYGGLWLTFACYMVLRVAAVGQLIPSRLHSEVSPVEAVLSAIALVGQYARKLLWPTPLIAFYPFQKSTTLFDPPVLVGLCTLVASLALFVFLWRRARLHSFSLLWIGLAVAPALNTRWMTASVFAERYLYLPSAGFCWLVAGGLLWLWTQSGERKFVSRWAIAVAIGILACLAGRVTVARTFDWRSDRALIVSTLRVLPDSPHMHVQYGMFRWAEGEHDEAEREWHTALRLNPDSVEAMAELGRARFEQKDYDQAVIWLQKAIDVKPHFTTAHAYLGVVYGAQGNSKAAEAELRRALEIHPNNTAALDALGAHYMKAGRLEDAANQFRTSIEIYPELSAWQSLGQIYDQLGQSDRAAEAWKHVLEFERFHPEAHRSLGLIYLSRHQLTDAQNEFQMCLLMNPKDPVALAGMEKIRNSSGVGSESPAPH